MLESLQAGLSWITVLRKREAYREVTRNFSADFLADASDRFFEGLLQDDRLIRNRGKILALRQNARAFKNVVAEEESFGQYLWSFVGGKPRLNHFKTMQEVPAQTDVSIALPAGRQVSRKR